MLFVLNGDNVIAAFKISELICKQEQWKFMSILLAFVNNLGFCVVPRHFHGVDLMRLRERYQLHIFTQIKGYMDTYLVDIVSWITDFLLPCFYLSVLIHILLKYFRLLMLA